MQPPPWHCPTCVKPLNAAPPWQCPACSTSYPELDGIPWLLPAPAASLAEWALRLTYLLQQIDQEADALKAELQRTDGVGDLTLRRLRKQLQAKAEHRKAISELLKPLTTSESGSLALSQAVQAQLPVAQSLTGYYANLHRDWAWETDENERSLACLTAVLAGEQAASPPELGHTLVPRVRLVPTVPARVTHRCRPQPAHAARCAAHSTGQERAPL